MNINGFGNASETMIEDFEYHIGFSLPEDYRQFLFEYNGGLLKDYHLFFVEELHAHIPLEVLYGLGLKRPVDLRSWNDEYRNDLVPSSVILGRDPGGAMIVLITDPSEEGIYYYDGGCLFEQSSDEHNTYKIADSFTSFIEGLRESDTWE